MMALPSAFQVIKGFLSNTESSSGRITFIPKLSPEFEACEVFQLVLSVGLLAFCPGYLLELASVSIPSARELCNRIDKAITLVLSLKYSLLFLLLTLSFTSIQRSSQ